MDDTSTNMGAADLLDAIKAEREAFYAELTHIENALYASSGTGFPTQIVKRYLRKYEALLEEEI